MTTSKKSSDLLVKTPLIFDNNMKYHVGINHEIVGDRQEFSYVVVAIYKDKDKLIVIDEGLVYDRMDLMSYATKFKAYCNELSEYYNSPILWGNQWVNN